MVAVCLCVRQVLHGKPRPAQQFLRPAGHLATFDGRSHRGRSAAYKRQVLAEDFSVQVERELSQLMGAACMGGETLSHSARLAITDPHSEKRQPSSEDTMGNKSSRVRSPPYANPSPTYARPAPYGRPSASLYSASAVSRTSNANYDAPSPAERGMLYGRTKNVTPAPTPSALYGKKSKSKSTKPAQTPKSLYSNPSAASTPKPTPTSLYSRKAKDTLRRGFSRSSISRSGVSLSGVSMGQPSPFAMSGASASSAYSRSTVAPTGALAQMPMTSCVKCRMPFGDSTAAFCRDCGHPRPAGTIPMATAQRANDERGSFGKQAVAF